MTVGEDELDYVVTCLMFTKPQELLVFELENFLVKSQHFNLIITYSQTILNKSCDDHIRAAIINSFFYYIQC